MKPSSGEESEMQKGLSVEVMQGMVPYSPGKWPGEKQAQAHCLHGVCDWMGLPSLASRRQKPALGLSSCTRKDCQAQRQLVMAIRDQLF